MKRCLVFLSFWLIFFISAISQPSGYFLNPIISGGHPDPSICRVGDDYYIVNSTFEYFPGLPIHHSKDLVNWELIGYALHDESQCHALKMFDIQQRGGIHAPTIRYHEGIFYIITTSVYSPVDSSKPTEMINFVITAKDPRGPWSEPHVLEGAPGIDPDIFFDDDGKVWYVGTHAPENPNFNGEGEIWLQEIDLQNWKLIGERHYLWRGACGGTWVEGPHMYKREGKYYLLVAEGGTHFDHAVMISVSDKITGPFISNSRNPILTTRNLSYDNWVNSTGHADLVELPDGRWYMVALGIRGDQQRASNMGRETHLIPVTWEREPYEWKQVKISWPVCAPESGRVERLTLLPFMEKKQFYNDAFYDNFDDSVLNMEWNFRRPPLKNTYSLNSREGYLRLYLKPETFALRGRYSVMGIRQKESDFEYLASMNFMPKKNKAEAGISLFQQDDNYINMTVYRQEGDMELRLSVCENQKTARIVKSILLDDYMGNIIFKVIAKGSLYTYYYSLDGGKIFTEWATTSSELILSRGYTGAYVGVYATSNGERTKEYADFDWISYKGYVR